jgi:membrane-bound lytic murein transglycosylase D
LIEGMIGFTSAGLRRLQAANNSVPPRPATRANPQVRRIVIVLSSRLVPGKPEGPAEKTDQGYRRVRWARKLHDGPAGRGDWPMSRLGPRRRATSAQAGEAGTQWLATACAVALAALTVACASGGAAPPTLAPSRSATAVPSPEPESALLADRQAPAAEPPAPDAGESEGDDGPEAQGAAIDAVADLPVGDAGPGEDALARASAAVEAESPDVPVDLNDAVLSCIDLYQGTLRDWFQEALSRGQPHLPHIRKVFAEEGVPQDLAYVALVESAFKTTAYSRAKAKGVWQFVSATGRRYGLAVDWWVDERSDPEKATRAAALYLKDLFELFGDWNLALAGYNAGEGKVMRAMARYGTDDFWRLRETRGLRRETKNYVPLVHAAIVLAKAPGRYGFVVAPAALPLVERVPVEGAVHLAVVAACAGESVEELRARNPELRRLATPADRTFALRVPEGRGRTVAECLDRRPTDQRVAWRPHVVRRGQTLGSIARANGVTARAVADANGITLQKRLRVGAELIVPVAPGPRVERVRREASAAGASLGSRD